ncbi:MAG TPA: 6-bladed beta-propeller [Longimicrobium sp.]|nr:6-bladed beta-propeller [Longimicrobium sp.]
MMLAARRSAGPLLAAALLALDAGAARAQGAIVRLPEQDRALAGTAPQVFALGKAEGAEHEMFGEVSSVAFDAAENLYVLDRQSGRVMVYDRTGRFLRQIGKKGQGPGELIQPMDLLFATDGTLVVSDLGRFGYSLFRTDGTFVRNVTAEGLMPGARAGLSWHPRGGVVGTFREAPGLQSGPPRISNAAPLMLVPFNGGQPSRIFAVPSADRVTQSTAPGPGGGTSLTVMRGPPPEFTPATLVGVLPDGNVALSFTSGYTVRVVDLNGQTLRYLQRPMRARLTTDRDREQAREARRERMASGRGRVIISTGGGGGPARPPMSDAQLERMMGEMEFMDTIPALQGMRVSPSGKLLVERTGANVGDPGPVDVITPEGQYLGTFTGIGLPDAISRGGLAAYIDYDDDGVGRVIVRRLPAGWR